MTGEHLLFLLCFLNSSLSEYLFSKIGTTTGVGTVRWKKFKIEQLYIPKCININLQKEIESIGKQIIDDKNRGLDTIQKEEDLNSLIYSVFNLTDDEIRIIEKI